MFKKSLLMSVAIAAVIASAPAAFAASDVSETATNSADTNNDGTIHVTTPGTLGLGASTAVGATGAVTSTSVSGINAPFINPVDGFGTIYHNATNQDGASTTNKGTITFTGFNNKTSAGSSVTVSANGALASLSVSGVGAGGNDTFNAPNVTGTTTQYATNSETVSNTGAINLSSGLTLAGYGSAVSISAGGAFASVSLSGISADKFTMGSFGGTIYQSAANNANSPVTNTVSANLQTAALTGRGASVSTGASGSTAAFGGNFVDVNSVAGASIANIIQNSSNSSAVTNRFTPSGSLTTGDLDGAGTSVSTSASGAVASVSFSNNLVDAYSTRVTLHDITQTATNGSAAGATIRNGDGIVKIQTGNLDGRGASVSATATGAVAAVGFSNIDSTYRAAYVGNVTQTATNLGSSTVTNTIPLLQTGALTADGTAVSASATGSLASVSSGSIWSTNGANGLRIGNVTQTSTNNSGVTNTATAVTTGAVSGDGSSVSTGASGAVASTAVTNIHSTSQNASIEHVYQQTTNNGSVNNSASTVTVNGDLSGDGSSASISANGALSALSVSSINSTPHQMTINKDVGGNSVWQSAFNTGSVTNANGTINVDTLSGVGSSAVVSSTGAAASLSVASIADTTMGSIDINGGITQTATNAGASVANTGTINAGGLTGTGASLSISAVGAGAFTSFHSVK